MIEINLNWPEAFAIVGVALSFALRAFAKRKEAK